MNCINHSLKNDVTKYFIELIIKTIRKQLKHQRELFFFFFSLYCVHNRKETLLGSCFFIIKQVITFIYHYIN